MSRVLVPLVVMSFNTAITSLHFLGGGGVLVLFCFLISAGAVLIQLLSYLGKMGQCYTSMERQPPPVSQY